MNFRDEILFAVQGCLYQLLKIDMSAPDPQNPGRFFSEKKLLNDQTTNVRMPNPGYFTPLWQVETRPILSEDVGQNGLIPSAYIRVVSGERSTTGRGLRQGTVKATTNDITEDYTLSIQCAFRDSYGAQIEGNADVAKSISEQVNGFVHDLDKCLNVRTLRPELTDAKVADAYIAKWEVLQTFEGSRDEVLVADLVVTINYDRAGI